MRRIQEDEGGSQKSAEKKQVQLQPINNHRNVLPVLSNLLNSWKNKSVTAIQSLVRDCTRNTNPSSEDHFSSLVAASDVLTNLSVRSQNKIMHANWAMKLAKRRLRITTQGICLTVAALHTYLNVFVFTF